MLWKSPYFYLVCATLLWGGNFVIGRAVSDQLPPLTLSLFRWLLALLIILPFTWKEFRKNLPLLKAYRIPIVGMALTGIIGFNSLLYIALHYTTSINAALVNTSAPFIMSLLSFLLLKERLSRIQKLGILLSFIGVSWIVSKGSWTILFSLSFNKGDLIMLFAVILWGLYSILIKRYASELPQASTFMLSMAIGVVLLIPFSISELLIFDERITWNIGTFGSIVYVGLFASLFAFYFWNSAVRSIGPSRSSVYLNLIPMFAAILATFFLNERVHWYQIVGAAFVLIGIWLSSGKGLIKIKKNSYSSVSPSD
ncbi:DMT family transporter [Alkalihalobacillus sp. AL-G]|uniref:DMT family transporter n=1 Tax=Alkalihalobacillus sp. AL-G TaxID=2926399 RepID=UPI00272BB62A|nr:DMT family transporter [Alkalihalobacillus sp. AL-G]WLD94262.1 DMT family transporter [Alkalihalobacillus sp. AL-G]